MDGVLKADIIVQTKYSDFVDKYRASNPHVLIGCTLFPNEDTDMNDLYFNCAEAYDQMINQLIDNGHIQAKEKSLDYDFSTAGFPRLIPNISAIEAIFIFIENNNGMLGNRIMCSISYQTTFIL